MDVTLQYFDGCPNWVETRDRLREALQSLGEPEDTVVLERVATPEDAERLGFRGSPTILVNGTDPFAEPSTPVGLACRMFQTPEGLRGAPTLEQLREALRR